MNTSRLSMYWNQRAVLLTLAVSLALVLAACEGDPTPINTQAAPTNTPTSESTATPTSVPTATPTSAPTATPTPEPVRQGTEEVRTSATEVPFAAASEVWIYGSGFEAGQEFYLLIADSTGAQTDITFGPPEEGGGSVTPLVANDHGAWATKWTLGRFSREGVGAPGQFSLTVVDTEYKVLATTPIALCPMELAEGEENPNFCSPLPEPTGTPIPGTPIPGTPIPGTPIPGTPIPGTPEPEASPTASPTP